VPRCRCPGKTLSYVAGIIRRHRTSIGSCWRRLNPGQEALLVLAYLRKGETFAQLAAGFGIGTTTAWRYLDEVVALLANRAPKLRQAVRDAKKAGHAYVILDGTLIPIDRVAADRPFYSGKHRKHGMNLQVIASPGGDVLWVSGALPGSVHDKKANIACDVTYQQSPSVTKEVHAACGGVRTAQRDRTRSQRRRLTCSVAGNGVAAAVAASAGHGGFGVLDERAVGGVVPDGGDEDG
jgi:hypothetical protein